MLMTKEEFVSMVHALEEKDEKVRKVSKALEEIDPENQIMSFESYEYYQVVQDLIRIALGSEENYETFNWWMYDCVGFDGKRKARYWEEGENSDVDPPHEIVTASELYDYLVNNQ